MTNDSSLVVLDVGFDAEGSEGLINCCSLGLGFFR